MYFQKEDMLKKLIKTIFLLKIDIILIRAKQIVIVDLNYHIFSNNQAEKKFLILGKSINP